MTFLLAFFIALVPPDALTIGLFMAKKKASPESGEAVLASMILHPLLTSRD
jgi:hypothetical protein